MLLKVHPVVGSGHHLVPCAEGRAIDLVHVKMHRKPSCQLLAVFITVVFEVCEEGKSEGAILSHQTLH